MTNNEKRFKIEKIQKYEEQFSKETKICIHRTLMTAMMATVSAMAFGTLIISDSYQKIHLINYILGSLEVGMTICSLKGMVESISEKTRLMIKIEDLTEALELAEEEEFVKIEDLTEALELAEEEKRGLSR